MIAANPKLGRETTPARWTFPSTEEEKLRYNTFKKLWEKGHFITSGARFGGDFLVYPGLYISDIGG